MGTKFIFVTGGVVSSLGKGINGSSIGRLLKNRGLKVFMQKFDPYINVDPGTMSPLQHGEVFVTEDGAETDLDLGHYERFIDENLNKHSSVTTGKIYLRVLDKERKGLYNGGTVQVIPHITNEIKECLNNAAKTSNADVIITEIGGTVGDIESLPFLEAIRQYRRDIGYKNTYYIHNTLVPYIAASQEIKTKPTQHSVKELRSLGINPDMIILRTEKSIEKSQKEKIALFCDVDVSAVIEAKDAKSIYEVPLNLASQNVDEIICNHFGLSPKPLKLDEWEKMVNKYKNLKDKVKIVLVGEYVDLKDAYISIYESLQHAGYSNNCKVEISSINASKIREDNVYELLKEYDGIIIPGGFDFKEIAGLLETVRYTRINKKPFFGICFGMHVALIEYAQNVLGIKDANTLEVDTNTKTQLFNLVTGFEPDEKRMRLGVNEIILKDNTLIKEIYKQNTIKERHRHKYKFNMEYINLFNDSEIIFSGICDKQNILESIELKNHPFFIGCQYHPEFLSRPDHAHPLFQKFIEKAKNN